MNDWDHSLSNSESKTFHSPEGQEADNLRESSMRGPAKEWRIGRIRLAVSARKKLPEMPATPNECARLLQAFASVRSSSTRAAIIDFAFMLAEEPAESEPD
jgi:hypothetical protein